MKIEKDKVASFHYDVFEADGSPIESSRSRGEPMHILFGAGNVIPGLEQALEGKGAGEHVTVTVEPEKAYGKRDPELVQRVPKKRFGNARLQPGQMLMADTRDGQRPLRVLKVGMSVVDVDLNHPLAGKTLRFEVDIENVRDATAEELAHRHAHGPGAHAHPDPTAEPAPADAAPEDPATE